MIGWLFKNPYMALGGLLILMALIGALYGKGYMDGRDSGQRQALEQAMTIKEKQDEARNNRPDVPAVAHSLRQHRF